MLHAGTGSSIVMSDRPWRLVPILGTLHDLVTLDDLQSSAAGGCSKLAVVGTDRTLV